MQPVAQRDLARLRTRRLALRHYCCLLRRAPTSPSRCPSQHFNATETVPINWQITWHTISLPRSNKAGSPHCRHPTQGGGRAPLTLFGLCGEQAVRCFVGICRRSPLERCQIQRAGAWMGSDKDGRPFSAGRSASGIRNPGLACHERGRVGQPTTSPWQSHVTGCPKRRVDLRPCLELSTASVSYSARSSCSVTAAAVANAGDLATEPRLEDVRPREPRCCNPGSMPQRWNNILSIRV